MFYPLSRSGGTSWLINVTQLMQSMCKPIIATDLGGSKETIVHEKTGILIESGNSNILADTIYKLMMMDGKTLEMMGLEGRKNVLKKFGH